MSVGINTPSISTNNTNYIPVEIIQGTLFYITVLRKFIITPDFQFLPTGTHVTLRYVTLRYVVFEIPKVLMHENVKNIVSWDVTQYGVVEIY